MNGPQLLVTFVLIGVIGFLALYLIFVPPLDLRNTDNNHPGSTECDYNQTGKSYISNSSAGCSLVMFTCAEGWKEFEDECGCGCEVIEA